MIKQKELDLKFFCTDLNNEIIDLRHEILRPGRLRNTAIFDKDFVGTTLHFVARTAGSTAPVCCVSYFLNDWKGVVAYQLRGMATAKNFQKMGIGKKLMAFAEDFIKKTRKITTFWCDARNEAIGFYESQGWTISGEEFIIKDVGPHKKMTKGIAPF